VELTETQRQNLEQGNAVRVPVPEIGMDCGLLRADVYERLSSLLEGEPDMHEVALLIERNMREDDANDPLLESYQDAQQ
jgi:hypothetical protein